MTTGLILTIAFGVIMFGAMLGCGALALKGGLER